MFKHALILIVSLALLLSGEASAQDNTYVTKQQHERLIRALRVLNGKLKASEELQGEQTKQIELLQKEFSAGVASLGATADVPSPAVDNKAFSEKEKSQHSNYNTFGMILIMLLSAVTGMLAFCVKRLRRKLNETNEKLNAVEVKEKELDEAIKAKENEFGKVIKSKEIELNEAIKQAVSALDQGKIASVEKLQLQLANASKLLNDQFESASKSLTDKVMGSKSKIKKTTPGKMSQKEDPNQMNMFDSLFD